jgi:CIC family chloride channel protein
MVLEVSQNYSIVLPVILANTIAYLLSRSLQPVPILEIFTHQDGLDLPSMEERREESDLHLEDALRPIAVPVLRGSETLSAAAAALAAHPDAAPAILIHCTDGLWYAAARQEMDELLASNVTSEPAAPPQDKNCHPERSEGPAVVGTQSSALGITLERALRPDRTPVLFPDLPLSAALPHFRRWPLLPITNRAKRGALEGAVSLQDVLHRYQQR